MDNQDVIYDLERFMPGFGDLFETFYGQLVSGEDFPGIAMVWEMICKAIKDNIGDFAGVFVSLLIIGILSAILHHCGDLFRNKQIVDLAFYFTYLYAVIILLQMFYEIVETVVTLVENIISFTQILIPAFYTAVAMCYASVTAGAFYQLNLLLLYAVEIIFPDVIIPMTGCYVFISLISGSLQEDRFAELANLFKKGVLLLIKICITTVTGVGVMKSLIHPIADSMKYTMFQKTVAAIPGIGDVTDSVSGMLLGSAMLIKNSIGIVTLILLITLVCTPLCKIFLISVMIKFSGACVGMFGDKRLTKCIDHVAEGGFLLLKSGLAVVMILFITIALVTAVAGKGM